MNRFCFAVCSCFVPVLLVPCLSANIAFAVTYQTVALSGQQAPGFPDGVILDGTLVASSLGGPLINNAGQVAFRWNVAGAQFPRAAWLATPGNLQLVARELDTPSDPAQFNYDTATELTGLSDSGVLAFAGNVLWFATPGNIQPVARAGDPAPGAAEGAVFTAFPLNSYFGVPRLNAHNQAAFNAQIRGPSDSSSIGSFWIGSPGHLQLCFKTGDPAPGAPPGATMSVAWPYNVTINDVGQAAVNAAGIWRVSQDHLEMIAYPGSGQEFSTANGRRVLLEAYSPSINNSGTVAFFGRTIDPDQTGFRAGGEAVFVGTPGNVHIALKNGDPAPDVPGAVVTSLGTSPLTTIPIDGSGQIGVYGRYTLGGDLFYALWLGAPDALHLLLRTGQPLPAISADVTVRSVPNTLALNSLGQAVFMLSLVGPGTDASAAIMAFDPIAGLIPVVRTGDLFEVAPGDLRTIANLWMRIARNSGGQDGVLRPINDLGQIAFTLAFTDNTQGVFIATIPEPASLFCLLATVLLASRQSVVLRH